jgi:hypothetical protein
VASIIARIAGKLATSRSRAIKVTADSKSIQMKMDADARLAAAAGGAARFLAEAAGLASEAAAELQKSIVEACKEAFDGLTGNHPHLTVTLFRYPDRIEVSVAHEGEASPAVGLDRIAGFAGQLGGSTALGGIDGVQFEAHEGQAVTRLTKYLGHAPHIA